MSESGLDAALDAALMQRLSRGDRAALAELYDRHGPRVYGLALSILGSREPAEDLVHEVFLEAWRNAAHYVEARGTVLAWLLVRTRSRAIDRRRSLRQARLGPGESLAASSDLGADAARILDQRRAVAALDCVSDDELQVIMFGYFEGLSSAEIAERLGVPVGTVKSRTRSALQKLRARLGAGQR